jgi:hypothetical protein
MVIQKEHPNIKILETAIYKLGPLVDEMVFLGGCATCLLLTDPATPPPRVTYDGRYHHHPGWKTGNHR